MTDESTESAMARRRQSRGRARRGASLPRAALMWARAWCGMAAGPSVRLGSGPRPRAAWGQVTSRAQGAGRCSLAAASCRARHGEKRAARHAPPRRLSSLQTWPMTPRHPLWAGQAGSGRLRLVGSGDLKGAACPTCLKLAVATTHPSRPQTTAAADPQGGLSRVSAWVVPCQRLGRPGGQGRPSRSPPSRSPPSRSATKPVARLGLLLVALAGGQEKKTHWDTPEAWEPKRDQGLQSRRAGPFHPARKPASM